LNLLLSLQESFQAGLRNLLHELPSLLIGGHPSTSRCFEGLRDMDHFAFLFHPHRQIKSRMKFSAGAFAPFLATKPLHRDQAPAEEGLFVEQFGQSGPGNTLGARKITAVSHKTTSFYLIYYNISD
jgi:hypothetical protein